MVYNFFHIAKWYSRWLADHELLMLYRKKSAASKTAQLQPPPSVASSQI